MNILATQWQGSGFTDELYRGANALGKYLSKYGIEFDTVEIAADKDLLIENDIIGYTAIETQLEKIDRLLQLRRPRRILTVGGGCGIEIPIVSYLAGRERGLKLLWFDAHGDLNSPREFKQ